MSIIGEIRVLGQADFGGLLEFCKTYDQDILPYQKFEDYAYLIGFFCEEKLVAALCSYQNFFHPYYLKCSVLVAPDFRRRGLGSRLHRYMSERICFSEQINGLEMACYEDNSNAIQFIESLAYDFHFDCNQLEFVLDTPLLIEPFRDPEICSLEDSKIDKTKLFKFLTNRYKEEHWWSPVADLSDQDWQKWVFCDVDERLSFCIIIDNQIAACSTACLSDFCLELIWTYARKSSEESQLLSRLLFYQLQQAQLQGVTSAFIEVDSYESGLSQAVSQFPLKSKSVWKRYRYKLFPTKSSNQC